MAVYYKNRCRTHFGVFLEKILGVSGKIAEIIKQKLIEVNLLEEIKTGRASKYYLLQPEVEDEDIYFIKDDEGGVLTSKVR